MANSHIRLSDLQTIRDRTHGTDEYSQLVLRLLKNYVINTDELNALKPKYEQLVAAEKEHAQEVAFLNKEIGRLTNAAPVEKNEGLPAHVVHSHASNVA